MEPYQWLGFIAGIAVLVGVFFLIRYIVLFPRDFMRACNKVSRERREAEHQAALAAGFTPEEIAAVDAKQNQSNSRFKGVIFGAATVVGMIGLSVLAFALLGPFALIIVIPKWAWYLKWAVGKLNSSEA